MAKKKTEATDTLAGLSKSEARIALKNKLNKEAGELLIGSLKEEAIKGINVISTGSPSLDLKLGQGGIPKGHITELYGPNQAGKSTLALQMATNVYKSGGAVIYVDAEYSLDVDYALALGLDVYDEDRFLLVQPDFGEQGFNTIWPFIKNSLVDLIIIDSYPMMVPFAALNSAETQGFEKVPAVALGARMWGFFLDKTLSFLKRNDIAMVILNQERVVSQGLNSLGTGRAGGNVLKHVDFVTIQLQSAQSNHKGTGDSQKGTYVGLYRETKATVTKNKMAPPQRQAMLTIEFGKGVNYFKDLLNVCYEYEVVASKSGSWITFIDQNGEIIAKVQGEDSAAILLSERKDLVEIILKAVLDETGIMLYNPFDPNQKIGKLDSCREVKETVISLLDIIDDDEVLFTEEEIERLSAIPVAPEPQYEEVEESEPVIEEESHYRL